MAAVADAPPVLEGPPETSAEKSERDKLYDWPYEFQMVPLDELEVDATYQRPLTTFWRTVKDKFNPALVGVLIVSQRRNGSKNIIDGQTRWVAMKSLNLPVAPCVVYKGLSKKHEAELFADLQTQRRGMRTYDRFRAQLIAERPEQRAIAALVEQAGFVLSEKEVAGKTMTAISALEKVYKVSPDHLYDVLQLIRRIWGTEERDAQAAQIIQGLSRFLLTQERVDYDRLVDRLQDVTPRMIVNKAAQYREAVGGGTNRAASVAEAILQQYMQRR